MAYFHLASLFLRIGLAGVFFYAAVAATLAPENWIGYFPGFILDSGFAEELLYAWSAFEVVLGLWLLSGKKVIWAAELAALSMVIIVIPNITVLDIVFRDIAILFMALSLVAMHVGDKKEPQPVPTA